MRLGSEIFRRLAAIAAVAFLMSGCDGPAEREAAYIERAKAFYEDDDYTKARLEFRNALQINPGGTAALYYLGRMDEQDNQWQRAFVAFTKVVEQEPGHEDANLRLGRIFLFAGDLDQALEKADTVLRIAPENADGHALRSAVYLRRDRIDEAKSEAFAALKIDPNNVSAISVLAGVYKKENKHDDALALLSKAIAGDRNNISLKLLKIAILSDRDERDKIVETYRGIFEAAPDDTAYRTSLAKLFIAWGRLDEAESVLREAIAKSPESDEPKLLIVDFLANQRRIADAEKELFSFISNSPENFALRFGLAALYVKDGQAERSEAVFREIIERDESGPHGLSARTALARIRLAKDDVATAEKLIGEVLKNDSSNGEALTLRAAIRMKKGEFLDAIADLRTVLRDNPESRQALNLLSAAHTKTGELELASQSLRTLVELDPLNHSARIRLAQLLLVRQGDLNAALRLLDEVLERAPNSSAALQSKAQVLTAQKDFEGARWIAAKIMESPDNQALGQQLLGRVYLREGNFEKAVDAYQAALRLVPRSPEFLAGLVQAHVARKRPEDAIKFLRSEIEADASNAFLRNLLGEVYVYQQQQDLAREAFIEAMKLRPDWAVPYLNLGRNLAQKGDAAQAIAILEEGVEKVPQQDEIRFALALAHLQEGDYATAIGMYEDMLKKNSAIDSVANNVAAMIADNEFENRERLQRALEVAQRFESSENPFFLDTLGWIHYRLEDFARALVYLERTIQLTPNVPEIRYHLGMAYYKAGQLEKAREHLQLATSDDADYAGAELAKSTLESLKKVE